MIYIILKQNDPYHFWITFAIQNLCENYHLERILCIEIRYRKIVGFINMRRHIKIGIFTCVNYWRSNFNMSDRIEFDTVLIDFFGNGKIWYQKLWIIKLSKLKEKTHLKTTKTNPKKCICYWCLNNFSGWWTSPSHIYPWVRLHAQCRILPQQNVLISQRPVHRCNSQIMVGKLHSARN
jgi:hypothetical protein